MREKRKERHAKINFQGYGSPPVGLPAGSYPVTFDRDSLGNIRAYVDIDVAAASLPDYLYPSTQVPTVASLTAINQSTGTAVDSDAGIYMKHLTTSTDYIFALVQTAPATPWTFTVAIIPQLRNSNFNHCGVCFSDGTKLVTWGPSYNAATGGLRWVATKWTDANTVSADYGEFVNVQFVGPVLWLRLQDNGTNRICSVSFDGVNFETFHTVSRTDFLTASKLGIYLSVNDGAHDIVMTCSSWLVV